MCFICCYKYVLFLFYNIKKEIMKKEKKPEFVYIHKPQYETIICSTNTKFDGNLTIISVKKLTDDAKKVKLSSIKEKCYINGYGQYNPKQK